MQHDSQSVSQLVSYWRRFAKMQNGIATMEPRKDAESALRRILRDPAGMHLPGNIRDRTLAPPLLLPRPILPRAIQGVGVQPLAQRPCHQLQPQPQPHLISLHDHRSSAAPPPPTAHPPRPLGSSFQPTLQPPSHQPCSLFLHLSTYRHHHLHHLHQLCKLHHSRVVQSSVLQAM